MLRLKRGDEKMGYYDERKRAIILIDEMFLDGKSTEQIVYRVTRMFGFSRKIVEERVIQHEELGAKLLENERKFASEFDKNTLKMKKNTPKDDKISSFDADKDAIARCFS